MFCRNCGKEVSQNAVACTGCGVNPLNGNKYCQNCGSAVDAKADVCVKCGVKLVSLQAEGERSWLVALTLAVIPITAAIGAHYFYVGNNTIGAIRVGLFIFCWIPIIGWFLGLPVSVVWWLVDIIRILTGSFKDAEGKSLKK